jgi:ABC-2 type transport system permease protein
MKSDWMKTRQTKYSAYVTVYILVVLALLAGVNYLASQYNKSADLTSNKRYTLSDQTIKVVKNLKDQVDIYYFDETKQFPPAKDLLDRYDAISRRS